MIKIVVAPLTPSTSYVRSGRGALFCMREHQSLTMTSYVRNMAEPIQSFTLQSLFSAISLSSYVRSSTHLQRHQTSYVRNIIKCDAWFTVSEYASSQQVALISYVRSSKFDEPELANIAILENKHAMEKNPPSLPCTNKCMWAALICEIASYVRNYAKASALQHEDPTISSIRRCTSYARSVFDSQFLYRFSLFWKILNRLSAPPGKDQPPSPQKPPRNPRGFLLGTQKTNFARLGQSGSDGRSAFGDSK